MSKVLIFNKFYFIDEIWISHHMNKFLSIQALRGIAALGVVAFHSLSIEQKYSNGDSLLPDFFRLGQSGVDLFFVISGFVMVTVTKERFKINGESMRFLWGRLSRIYPTYWFYFLLVGSIFFLKPGWVNASQGHQIDLISSFLLLPDNQLPLVMVAWSLIHELWFYLVFAVLLMFHERMLSMLLFLWAAIIIVVNSLFTLGDFSPGARIVFHPYSLEFIIGALVAVLIQDEKFVKSSARDSIISIVLVPAIGIPVAYVWDVLKQDGVFRMSVFGVLYGFLIFSFVTLEKTKKIKVPKPLQAIGDMSYTIYLSHILVLSAIGRLWMLISVPYSLIDNALAFLIMFAAVVGYGWVGYRLIERPIVQISHRLRARWFE